MHKQEMNILDVIGGTVQKLFSLIKREAIIGLTIVQSPGNSLALLAKSGGHR